MNALAEEGFLLLAGPLAGTQAGRGRVLLIVDADDEREIRHRLEEDPWAHADRLVITSIEPWNIFVAIPTFNLGTFGVFLYTSLYFQNMLGYSPLKAGSALLPWILVLIVLGPFTGTLAERLTPRWLIAGGLLVMACGLALLTGIDEHSAYVDLLPGLVLGGIGGALTIPLSGVAIAAAPVEKSGVASGVFNTAREAGGALGITIIGAVVASGGHAGVDAFVAGYSRGIAVAAVLAVAAAIVAALTLGDRRDARVPAAPAVIAETA
jgi:predicted MFS family arabinose efflux permease